jgi:hypothetical protein
MSAIDDLQEAIERIKCSQSTIICPPNLAQRILDRIDQERLLGVFEIVESDFIDADKIYVFSPKGDLGATAR